MDNLVLVSPVGTASYPHLNEPDDFKGVKKYKCKLILDASKDDVIAFRTKLDSYAKRAQSEAIKEATEILEAQSKDAKSPKAKEAYQNAVEVLEQVTNNYRLPMVDEWDDNDTKTGNLILDAKSHAEFKKKDTGEVISLAPKFYDATPALMTTKPYVSGGAQIALEVIFASYLANVPSIGGGVTARIRSVQIISLAGGTSGFGAVDGGFDGAGYVAPQTPEVDQTAGADEPDSSVY